ERFGDDGAADGPYRSEPYRRLVTHMMSALTAVLEGDDGAYDATRFDADLDAIRTSLEQGPFAELARHGRIARACVLARTFGLHMAAHDVRQHSALHEQ